MQYFDFGNEVRARIRNVVILSTGFNHPRSPVEVEKAKEINTISIAALPEQRIFVVIVDWQLQRSDDERSVWCKVAVEFEIENFYHVFNVSNEGRTISPRLAVDKQFFSIAYQTTRGIVVAKLAGTPWSRRIPALISADELKPNRAEGNVKVRRLKSAAKTTKK